MPRSPQESQQPSFRFRPTHRTINSMSDSFTGRMFGKWTVTGSADGERKGHDHWWHCRCECGTDSIVSASNLLGGHSRSCGCMSITQGGLSTTREYSIWAKMLRRCYSKGNDNYRFYGAIGTIVCEGWRESFSAFLADMGVAPSPRHSLDRKNTQGSYTCGKCAECSANHWPANCRWASKEEQARNQKSNRYYTHDGKTLILKDWARISGIKYLTLWNRLKIGVPFEVAISAKRYDRKTIKNSKL